MLDGSLGGTLRRRPSREWREYLRRVKSQCIESRWSGGQNSQFKVNFFECFMKLGDTVVSGLGRRYYNSANKVLRGLGG